MVNVGCSKVHLEGTFVRLLYFAVEKADRTKIATGLLAVTAAARLAQPLPDSGTSQPLSTMVRLLPRLGRMPAMRCPPLSHTDGTMNLNQALEEGGS